MREMHCKTAYKAVNHPELADQVKSVFKAAYKAVNQLGMVY